MGLGRLGIHNPADQHVQPIDYSAHDTGDWVYIGKNKTVSFQFSEATGPGTHVGTIYIEESADESAADAVTALNVTVASGAAADASRVHPDAACQYVRWRYARTSGTGTGQAIVTVKP